MNFALNGALLALALFFGVLLSMELGRRIGVAVLQKNTEGHLHGIGAVEGAVFALLGLLHAFTFSGAFDY
jgi:hypothetical protein